MLSKSSARLNIGIGRVNIGVGSVNRSNRQSVPTSNGWKVEPVSQPRRKRRPSVRVESQSNSEVEIHDNGDHYQLIGCGDRPVGLAIDNLIAAISKTQEIWDEVIKNGIWSLRVRKE